MFAERNRFEVKEGNTVFGKRAFPMSWCLLARIYIYKKKKKSQNRLECWIFMDFFLGKPIFKFFFFLKNPYFGFFLGGTPPSFCYHFIPAARRATPYCRLRQPQPHQNTQFGGILKTQDNFPSPEPSFPHRRLQISAMNSLENWEINHSALKTPITRRTRPI